MNERYTRLYSLPNNLYLDGAPLLIVAGALLKDNKTGRTLAQLKLRNLYHSHLTACKVHIKAFDPGGAELQGVDSHTYLDLNIVCGADFGTQTPIFLPDKTTRRFLACVTQAVFEDGTVWQHPTAGWSPPPLRFERIADRYQDVELQKQYSIEVGGNCEFVPETCGSLYLCTCGTMNLASEKTCFSCQRNPATLVDALAPALLMRKKDQRLVKEEAERREQERIAKERQIERERLREIERVAAEQREAAEAAHKKHTQKVVVACAIVVAAVLAISVVAIKVIIPNTRYRTAEKMLAEGNYDEAITIFTELGGYKDSFDRIGEAEAEKEEAALAEQYGEADSLSASSDTIVRAAIAFAKLGDYSDAKERSAALWEQIVCRNTIAAARYHTVGLRADGTVLVAGANDDGQGGVSNWSDIIMVAAGASHTVGLKSDGTVVAVGKRFDGNGQNVYGWSDIVAVAAGVSHIVGLQSDGTVRAIGENSSGQCNVSDWSDIIAVAAGSYHTVGLKSDGTVVAVGANNDEQCNVSDWSNIVAVVAGDFYTVGLKSDGTVVTAGKKSDGRGNVSEWSDIIMVAAGESHTVGLKSDGTVVAVGTNNGGQCNVSEWSDIVAVAAGASHTVGLRSDGTVVAVGYNKFGQCSVSEWSDIRVPR